MVGSIIFDADTWAHVPFHFWSVVFFVLGCLVGSFLNVCIHRMPLGQSIVSPPSHCPHCNYSIPWYLNIPLVTWLYLRGKCANCGAVISARYFLVELLTGFMFLFCWLGAGHISVLLALVQCVFVGGLIVGTFIDIEHLIIPDEITLGGTVVGFFFSLVVPSMHHTKLSSVSLGASFVGILVGGGLLYGVSRGGKLLFGRQHIDTTSGATLSLLTVLSGRRKTPAGPLARVVFTESFLVVAGQQIPYEDVYYRQTDTITLTARRLELCDRCYRDVPVRLTPTKLRIGTEELNPVEVVYMEAETDTLVLPREAMGLGDVKLMAAIGAFGGWEAVVFSLFLSAIIGIAVQSALILAKKREWSNQLPYVPYIAAAAIIWIFLGQWWWLGFVPR